MKNLLNKQISDQIGIDVDGWLFSRPVSLSSLILIAEGKTTDFSSTRKDPSLIVYESEVQGGRMKQAKIKWQSLIFKSYTIKKSISWRANRSVDCVLAKQKTKIIKCCKLKISYPGLINVLINRKKHWLYWVFVFYVYQSS